MYVFSLPLHSPSLLPSGPLSRVTPSSLPPATFPSHSTHSFHLCLSNLFVLTHLSSPVPFPGSPASLYPSHPGLIIPLPILPYPSPLMSASSPWLFYNTEGVKCRLWHDYSRSGGRGVRGRGVGVVGEGYYS